MKTTHLCLALIAFVVIRCDDWRAKWDPNRRSEFNWSQPDSELKGRTKIIRKADGSAVVSALANTNGIFIHIEDDDGKVLLHLGTDDDQAQPGLVAVGWNGFKAEADQSGKSRAMRSFGVPFDAASGRSNPPSWERSSGDDEFFDEPTRVIRRADGSWEVSKVRNPRGIVIKVEDDDGNALLDFGNERGTDQFGLSITQLGKNLGKGRTPAACAPEAYQDLPWSFVPPESSQSGNGGRLPWH